jgi:hypothetical protein
MLPGNPRNVICDAVLFFLAMAALLLMGYEMPPSQAAAVGFIAGLMYARLS